MVNNDAVEDHFFNKNVSFSLHRNLQSAKKGQEHCSVEDVGFAIQIFKLFATTQGVPISTWATTHLSPKLPFIHIRHLHSGFSFPIWMIFFFGASTSILPSSFSGTCSGTSSVSCASASSLKRALRQPMRLAGQLRLGCVSDRGLTMLMKVFCTWPHGFFVHFCSTLSPPGGLEGLDATLYGRLSSQKSLFFFES